MKKKLVAASMAAVMAATMMPAAAFASESDLPTITFMVPEYSVGHSLQNEGSDQIIAAMEDYTGIHVEFDWEDNSAYDEILATTLMDFDNMPMILTVGGTTMSGLIQSAAAEGAFWDLTPYLQDSERFPNLAQMDPNILDGLTVEGEIVGLYRAREVGRNGISYRKDWAEAVGITEAPQTVDDLYDMLYKFTYEDPDGNGKDDTYGLELCSYTGPFDIMQTWFGCGNGWVEQEDGTLIPIHMTEEYKTALDWFKKIYDDGLVRSDWVEISTDDWSGATKKGETGVYVDVMDNGRKIWDYFVNNEIPSVTNPDEYASMDLLGTINGVTLSYGSGFNGYYLITKDGAKTEEDVINCLTFLDKMNDYEMMILADYGIEGLSFDWNDEGLAEAYVYDSPDNAPHYGLNQTLTYVPGYPEGLSPTAVNERTDALNDCYVNRTRPGAVYNPAASVMSSSPTYTEYGADLDSLISQARTQYICGIIDEQGLQDAWDEWYEKGGEDVIAEVNEAYVALQGAE